MRLIVCKEKQGMGNQILTKASGIPNLDDIVIFSENNIHKKYFVVEREWFMSGDDFEKSLEISSITISEKRRAKGNRINESEYIKFLQSENGKPIIIKKKK